MTKKQKQILVNEANQLARLGAYCKSIGKHKEAETYEKRRLTVTGLIVSLGFFSKVVVRNEKCHNVKIAIYSLVGGGEIND